MAGVFERRPARGWRMQADPGERAAGARRLLPRARPVTCDMHSYQVFSTSTEGGIRRQTVFYDQVLMAAVGVPPRRSAYRHPTANRHEPAARTVSSAVTYMQPYCSESHGGSLSQTPCDLQARGDARWPKIESTAPRGTEAEGRTWTSSTQDLQTGDIVEFTVKGERRTAEVMLVTIDDVVLLDLFDGDRPAWARRTTLRGRGDLPPESPTSSSRLIRPSCRPGGVGHASRPGHSGEPACGAPGRA